MEVVARYLSVIAKSRMQWSWLSNATWSNDLCDGSHMLQLGASLDPLVVADRLVAALTSQVVLEKISSYHLSQDFVIQAYMESKAVQPLEL